MSDIFLGFFIGWFSAAAVFLIVLRWNFKKLPVRMQKAVIEFLNE